MSFCSSCLALLAVARVAQALTWQDESLDQVSLIQLSSQVSEDAESAAVYEAIAEALSVSKNLTHSRHIFRFVQQQPYAPRLRGNGCLYLPNDAAWTAFYSWVEHPYPPLFAELIYNAFDPHCGKNETELTACPAGHVKGSHWALIEGVSPGEPGGHLPHEAAAATSSRRMPHSLEFGNGCVGATYTATSKNIQIFETEGHVGMPGKWMAHVDVVRKEQQRGKSRHSHRASQSRKAAEVCYDSESLPAAPAGKKLAVPTRFIVCCVELESCPIDKAMIEEQVKWMTEGYSGREPWTEVWFDAGRRPQQVDMQLEFDLKDIRLVEDPECAQHALSNSSLAQRHNTDGEGMLTYVIATDDQSGVLGMAEFPNDWKESSPELLVLIDSKGVRHWGSNRRELDLTYDEGDTCIHEGGHSLGLFHTFEGGCGSEGDRVADTMPEQFPKYLCEDEHSCGSSDPVHNFMDYTPDSCMNGFTELQKRRLWCMVSHYRPKLYERALMDA